MACRAIDSTDCLIKQAEGIEVNLLSVARPYSYIIRSMISKLGALLHNLIFNLMEHQENHSEAKCLDCGKVLEGRKGKKFCNPHCKSSYHYRISSQKEGEIFKLVEGILKNNRKILGRYNRSGMTTIRKEDLIAEGFRPSFFTHYWKNSQGEVYWFVFEFGFKEIFHNERPKYLLVKWQGYMGNLH